MHARNMNYASFHCSLLEKVHDKVPSCIKNPGRFQGLPLHSACGYGQTAVVRKLVEWDPSATHLEFASVPADLPAFTKTSEPKEIDEVTLTNY